MSINKTAQLVNVAIKSVAVTAITLPFMFTANAEESGNNAGELENTVEVIEVKGIRSSILKRLMSIVETDNLAR